QYTSVRLAETLHLAGLTGSTGTVGDAYDNALAETTIGLCKGECVRDGSPFRDGPLRTMADVEKITSQWVHWYDTERLMHRLGGRSPAEAEAACRGSQGEPVTGAAGPGTGPPPGGAAPARRPAAG